MTSRAERGLDRTSDAHAVWGRVNLWVNAPFATFSDRNRCSSDSRHAISSNHVIWRGTMPARNLVIFSNKKTSYLLRCGGAVWYHTRQRMRGAHG